MKFIPNEIAKAFSLLEPQTRLRFFGLIGIALIASMLEATGVMAAFALINAIVEPSLILNNEWLKDDPWVQQNVESKRIYIFAAVGLAAFYLVKNVFLAYATYAQKKFIYHTSAEFSIGLIKRYLFVPYQQIFDRNSADLLVGVQQVSNAVAARLLGPAIIIVTEILILVGVLAVLLTAEPTVTVVTAVAFGGLIVVYHLLTRRFFIRWARTRLKLDNQIYKIVNECLGCLKELKVLGKEDMFHSQFVTVRSALARIDSLNSAAGNMPRLLNETLLVWTVALVVILVMVDDRSSSAVISTLGLFAFAGFRLMPSANRLQIAFSDLKSGLPPLQRLSDDYQNLTVPSPPQDDAAAPFQAPVSFRSHVSVQNLVFHYPKSSGPVLDGLSFTIRQGQTVGIVGASGAGKTTLADVLLGIFQPQEGCCTVDGRAISFSSSAWRQLVGYVPQETYLLDESLKRNIALSATDDCIDSARIKDVISKAALNTVVDELPKGVETTLGERGVLLSGGQRQRIGIARALYHDPEILIMDEATSALDTGTEREIISTIERLRGLKTVIIVAHRLSTVRHCDALLFLRNGKLVDSGTFEEIKSRNKDFARLVQLAEVSGSNDLN